MGARPAVAGEGGTGGYLPMRSRSFRSSRTSRWTRGGLSLSGAAKGGRCAVRHVECGGEVLTLELLHEKRFVNEGAILSCEQRNAERNQHQRAKCGYVLGSVEGNWRAYFSGRKRRAPLALWGMGHEVRDSRIHAKNCVARQGRAPEGAYPARRDIYQAKVAM